MPLLMSPVVDLQATFVRIGFDEELLREMATLCREDAPRRFHELRNAAQGADRRTVCHKAHALKGIAANFGAERTMRAAAEVEALAPAASRGVLLTAIDELRDAVEEMLSALAELVAADSSA